MITENQPGKHCTCENTAWLMSPYCDVIWEHDREIKTVILFLLHVGGENSQPQGKNGVMSTRELQAFGQKLIKYMLL